MRLYNIAHKHRSESGVAMLEFGLILPILMVILLGSIEFARYVIINQKLDKTASAMADFVTQGESINCTQLDGFAATMPQIMEPYDTTGMQVIFNSVAFFHTPIPPCTGQDVSCITWQHASAGGNSSHIGSPGGNATMPGGYVVLPGQNAITAEVFYNYAPLFSGTGFFINALSPQLMYKVAMFKPRRGTLTVLECP